MSGNRALVIALAAVLTSACSAAFENSRYYVPKFAPMNVIIPLCPHAEARTAVEIDSVISFQKPFPGGCGPIRDDWIPIYRGGVSGGSRWIPIDGGFGMAGTNYSLQTLFPEDRERERVKRVPAPGGPYFASDYVNDLGRFVSNGIEWEHVVLRELTKYPKETGLGPNPRAGPARLQRLRDVYIHKHSEGWWLRVQANFRPEMEGYPDILSSRRDTLRQVVESIRIEPKEPARISCTSDERGRESCRYRWP